MRPQYSYDNPAEVFNNQKVNSENINIGSLNSLISCLFSNPVGVWGVSDLCERSELPLHRWIIEWTNKKKGRLWPFEDWGEGGFYIWGVFMTSLNTSSSTVWFLPAAGDILSKPGPIGRERASCLGVLCWSLNFGALKNSWEEQYRVSSIGRKATKLPTWSHILAASQKP